ncbi:unnamed protein product [Anisakis simplex]|uniref:Ovule protein n=1 Tax=Anisakis simplex TaxID=6269 RepID=A0A0M3K7U4_ANISI|nr:unnamed protein product [Anisakis simplex]
MELEMFVERQRRELQLARQRVRQSRAHLPNAFVGSTSMYETSSGTSPAGITHLPFANPQFSHITNAAATTSSTQNSSLSLPPSPPHNPPLQFDFPSTTLSPRDSKDPKVSRCCDVFYSFLFG